MLCVLLPSMSYGACGTACTKAGTTHTCTDLSRDCIVDAVGLADYGDTISLGAGTAIWTAGVTITKDLKIQGAGINSTFIDVQISTINSGIFIFEPDDTAETNIETLNSSGLFEITGITFTSLNPQTATISKNLELLKVDGSKISKVIKKIRVHHNRAIYFSHILGQEVGYSHGLIDNNHLFNVSLYYTGATTYSLNNLIHPGDGGGWYFEDNIIEWSSSSMRRGTVSAAKVLTSEFTYWIAHTLYTASTAETALPAGTIPTGKYGIFKMSANTSGVLTITAGADNATGYASSTAAIAGIPATPEGQYNVGGFYVYNNSGEDFVNGTTNLNATGVTTTFGENGSGGFVVGGGNNGGAGFTVRYNKAIGTVGLTLTGDTAYESRGAYFFDAHSNQTGITGGQLLEMYGNNLIATLYNGQINVVIQGRGQKNIYFYNTLPALAETDVDFVFREEMNDGYSVGNNTPGSESTVAALAALNMCLSRTTYNGEPSPQVCPGYYIGLPDRVSAERCGCWKVHDSYVVNNRKTSGTLMTATTENGDVTPYDNFGDGVNKNDPREILENREWFNYVEIGSFNGSVGVTCGTAEQMNAIEPTTTGVGFWVPTSISDMPCTEIAANNIKQAEGVNPVTPISGTLYKWDGDSWEPFWRPFTYPHPLRTEETPPSLTVTVTNTGSGHSPSHDGARTVQTGGSLTFTSGVYNGWKVTIGGTCGCITDGCTVTPTEACTITCTSSEIQLMPW